MNKLQVLKGLTVLLGALVLFTGCNMENEREVRKEAGKEGTVRPDTNDTTPRTDGTRTDRTTNGR